MHRCVQVVLDAPRYARALLALQRVRRCWYDLETAIIETQPATWNDARRQEVLQLLVKMDACIARADGMLTRQPANVKMSDSLRCSAQPNEIAHQLQARMPVPPQINVPQRAHGATRPLGGGHSWQLVGCMRWLGSTFRDLTRCVPSGPCHTTRGIDSALVA